MNRTHQIKLKPTKAQEVFFKKSCGVARFAYNWALNKWSTDFKEKGTKWTAYSLIKHLNSIKKTEFPWMQETGKCASQYAVHNLESAYKKMWKEGARYPKFKKRGDKDSFVAVENKQQFKQKDFKIWVPRLGWVKCCENLRFEGKVNNVAIKRTADMWFAYVNIEVSESIPALKPIEGENQAIVGVDFGISKMMVCSDGTVYENPRALKSNLKSLKRLQRGLIRKEKGSNNKYKQQIKLARKYYKVSCIRKNAIHQATTAIVKKYDKIVIETLKPQNMVKNHNLAQAIGDVSFGEIARQLAYKCLWNNKQLDRVDQWYPSSKLCSKCGNKKDKLSLSERTYKCENCGLEMDRDLNAAINLANYSPTLKYKGSEACGEGSSVKSVMTKRSPSKKQEIIKFNHRLNLL
jgi:putative transposase